MDLITALRVVCIVLWAVPVLWLVPSIPRLLTRRHEPNDDWRAACAFMGLLLEGFFFRWLLAPQDMQVFAVLYILCGVLAVYVIGVSWSHGERRG